MITTSRPLLDADYAAIEARIVNWLAGQEDALERFRRYDAAQTEEEQIALDPYRIMASQVYRKPVAEISKFPERFVGKSLVLGAGYGLGPAKFRETCKRMGYDLPAGLEEKAIKTWRTTHRKVVSYWYELEKAAKSAIVRKGTIVHAKRVSFLHKDVEGLAFLFMKLPSGRKISYPKPRISGDRITYFGNYMGANWGDISMWGGVLMNGATQGTAACLMAAGAMRLEDKGYQLATLVHDEALGYYDASRGQTAKEFGRLMAEVPPWGAGLPVSCEGELVPFYRKG